MNLGKLNTYNSQGQKELQTGYLKLSAMKN